MAPALGWFVLLFQLLETVRTAGAIRLAFARTLFAGVMALFAYATYIIILLVAFYLAFEGVIRGVGLLFESLLAFAALFLVIVDSTVIDLVLFTYASALECKLGILAAQALGIIMFRVTLGA